MSSLAAARADNFYFPPDWCPEFGSISKFQGSKGANQYEQKGIVRFELPFDGWCLNCHRHVSKGTRFNAKKEEEGKYLSTKIWSFHTKCASCDQKFIIRTNPKDRTYDFVEGLRQMEQEFTPDFDDSIIAATTDEQRLLLSTNPIARLENDGEDRKKVLSTHERLLAISEIKDEQFYDDYTSNSKLRTSLRTKKHKDRSLLREGHKYGLNIPLVEANPVDAITAKLAIQNREINSKSSVNTSISKLNQIQNSSIFATSSNTGANATSGGKGSRWENSKTTKSQQKKSKQTKDKTDASPIKITTTEISSSKDKDKVKRKRTIYLDNVTTSSNRPSNPTASLKQQKTDSITTNTVETGSIILDSLLSGYTSD